MEPKLVAGMRSRSSVWAARSPRGETHWRRLWRAGLCIISLSWGSRSGVDTHAAFLNLVHCNFNMTNCIFKTPLVPVVVRPPVPNILSSSVPSFSSSPKPRNISHSWIWCYHVMMDQFMSRTFLSPIWSSFQHDQHEKSFASYFIFRSDSRSYLTLISTMTREWIRYYSLLNQEGTGKN